jgi:O-antigen/teichoic acid export membrane protein
LSFFSKYKNYVITFGTEIIILFLSFVIFRVANERMTDIAFSEYALSRRNISFLQPLLMIGLGVAVPRYVSIHPKRDSFLPASLMLMTIVSFFFLLVLTLGSGFFSNLFFGDLTYQNYILPLCILLIGYGYHAILYGYLRGKKEVYFSNLIQLVNIGFLPISVLLYTQNVQQLLLLNGIFLLVSCLIFGLYVFIKRQIQLDFPSCWEDAKLMLNFGLPRILGDFALLAILTFPTYIVLSLQKNVLTGGDVAYSITLLNLVGAAFGPLSLVLLPEIGGFLAEKRIDLIKKRFYVFVLSGIILTVIGYLTFYFFHEVILNLLLGKDHRNEIFEIAHIVLLGSFGYVLYIILRSFLDAIHVKAKNATNLLIALIIYIAMAGYGYSMHVKSITYIYYFVISLNTLGLLTFIKTYNTIKNLK